ncbi:Cation-transporting ATPase, E1-E2 family [hydrothermal vent metagenome]|uniref:Cation-transporting ATPase, E1-E2 family n=1 Tax=hydrothermal vent metagenome TaxID=652676 RepID=A0A3B0VSI2_9ZZZZ
MRWHTREIKDVIDSMGSSAKGLTGNEALRRLSEYGTNTLKEGKKRTRLRMLGDQFKDFMILVLIAAAVVSGIVGDLKDTLVIVIIIILNAVIGFVQEYRAEKAIEALRSMAAPRAFVRRGGEVVAVASAEIVPGDIVLLEAGRVVPADLRIIESANLKIDEAALTGESMPVEKHTAKLHDGGLPLGDRRNMAFKGTVVPYGRGVGIAVATGMETELGAVARMLSEEKEVKTPLQKRMARFGKKIAIAILFICALIFAVGLARGEEPLIMLLTAISLAVAAIPEALPAVITVSLALGAKKLIKNNALIRKLPAVETLGSVTFICTDKTGTLTMNRMSVEEVFTGGDLYILGAGAKDTTGAALGGAEPGRELLTAMALSNDACYGTGGALIGDPTETAIFKAALDNGYDKKTLDQSLPRVAELPFDSDRKMMTTFHKDPSGGYVSYTKGGVEVIIDRSSQALTATGPRPIDRGVLTKESERMAGDGLRVLAVGMRRWPELPQEITSEVVEADLTILGYLGLMDPPRPEAKEAIKLCKRAGIRPVMITGDHPITARAIALRLGIISGNEEPVMTGPHLERLPLEEFEEKVLKISVYARVAPEQKLKIIKALQDKGEFVAMTGDGVNDAPALKRADIGVSMGITGTDVAKEASHMILLDDNFASIVGAVQSGRRIYDNIRKFIRYTMTSNSAEIWTIFLPPFFGLPIPLLPIHILWINLVTDGLPGLALAAEPEEAGIMQRPPRHPKESVFAGGMGLQIIWVGFLMGGLTVLSQALSLARGAHWQTIVFTVLCLSQMGYVLSVRSETKSVFSRDALSGAGGILSNKTLLGAVALTFILQMATIYVPLLQGVFKTEALTIRELVFALATSSIVFIVMEFLKLGKNTNHKKAG